MANVILSDAADKRLQRKFGADFPSLTDTSPEAGAKWRAWLMSQREQQESQMRDRRLHYGRHRNFRIGNQWISTRDSRTWREPKADKTTVRNVLNLVGPALDFRHGVIAEQRPGFRHELMKTTIEAREQAEAQQAVAEHYFHKLNTWRTFMDAAFHAQTDGICFVHVYVNKNGGKYVENALHIPQQDERYAGFVAQGYDVDEIDGTVIVPLDDAGGIGEPGAPTSIAEGDLANRIVLAHDTMADPEARVLNGEGDAARWFMVRRPRELKLARLETGNDALEAETLDSYTDPLDSPQDSTQGMARGLPPFPGARQKFKECVYENMVYIAPDGQDIPNGLWRRLIGDTIVDGADELPGKKIPFAVFGDGSPDASLYKRPTMSDWCSTQTTINALLSQIVAQSKAAGMGRLLSLKGTLLTETFTTITGSNVEYDGPKPEKLDGQNVSSDTWQTLTFLIRQLENITGFNDTSRGQVLGEAGGGMQDVSGRAVLGAQEALSKTFGPMVQATADGATQWAEIVVAQAAWLYGDTPRMIPTVGGRGDLAKLISKEHLEGDCSVYVDAATLMPLPAQLREQLLVGLLDKGYISLAEYQKRAPYAQIQDVYMGDMDQVQRAQWINTMMEEATEKYTQMQPAELYTPGVGLPVLWQDDPGVHLTALNEIILNERKPWPLRKLASDRSTIYDQLQQAKADPMQPVPLECIGVPMNRMPSATPPAAGVTLDASGQPTNVVPGAGGASAPAMPGAAPQDSAEPLGTVGAVEANSTTGQQL